MQLHISDGVDSNPPTFRDLRIPTTRKKVQLTFFGKIRAFHTVSILEWIYVALSVIGLTISAGITIQRIASEKSNTDDFTFAVLLLFTIVFCFYYVFHSILTERADELLVFVSSSIIVLVYCVANYILQERNTVKLVRLISVSVSSPFLIILGLILSYRYCCSNHLIYNTVGGITNLQKSCRIFYLCSSLLKFDLQLQLSMLILIMGKEGTSMDLFQKIILGLGVTITVIFVIVGFLGMREENQILMIIFYILGLLEPAYVIYKFYYASTREKDKSSATYESTFVCGCFALIVWIALMASTGYYATYCFGKGLNEKLFGLRKNSIQSATNPSGKRITTYLLESNFLQYDTARI